MPVYNEESIIERTVRDFTGQVLSLFDNAEMLVVDDHSSDNTVGILSRLQQEHPRLQVITNTLNRGHGPSLLAGIARSKGELVLLMDSDYQIGPEAFSPLLTRYAGFNVVTARRTGRDDGAWRNVASAAANAMLRLAGWSTVHDVNVPFKLFPGNTLRRLANNLPDETLAPSTLLLMAAIKQGIRIDEVDVKHRRRPIGTTSLPGWRFLVFAGRAAREIFSFARQPR